MFVHVLVALCLFLWVVPEVAARTPSEKMPYQASRIKKVSPALYRGPRLCDEVLNELKRLRVKTIVMVRTNPQKKFHKRAHELGMNVIHLHTGVFKQSDEYEIDAFLNIAKDPARQPLYIACYAGEVRTSFFVAIYRIMVQNWTFDRAYQEMQQYDLKEWWYAFRDYKKTIKEYAERKSKGEPTVSSTGSLTSQSQ